MKIHLKDNKIALYDIESDYRQYLFQYDFRLNLKSGRRFVGIIVGIEDYTYFIPLASKPLRKNGKRRNPRTTVEIYNESHEIIAALLINNMIPVPQGVYKRIDINNDKYKDYLNNEYIYLKKQSTREEIERKINNVVNAVFVKKDEFLTSFCCDYLKLQALCDQWKYK